MPLCHTDIRAAPPTPRSSLKRAGQYSMSKVCQTVGGAHAFTMGKLTP